VMQTGASMPDSEVDAAARTQAQAAMHIGHWACLGTGACANEVCRSGVGDKTSIRI
jgi:hypothetical protein